MDNLPDETLFIIGTFCTYDEINNFINVFPIENTLLQEKLLNFVYNNDIIKFFEKRKIYKDNTEYLKNFPDYEVNPNEPDILRYNRKIMENEFKENKLTIKEIKENFTFELNENNRSFLVPRKAHGLTNLKILTKTDKYFKLVLLIGGQIIDTYENIFTEEQPFDLNIIPFPMYYDVRFKLESPCPIELNFDYILFEEFEMNVMYEWWFTQHYYNTEIYSFIKEIYTNNQIIIDNKKIRNNVILDYPINITDLKITNNCCFKVYNKFRLIHGMCGLVYCNF